MPSLTSPATFGDLITKVYRRVMGGVRERSVSLSAGINNSVTAITLAGAQTVGIFAGTVLSVDLELIYVVSFNDDSLVAQVLRGWNGSTADVHSTNATCYVNPRYSYYDIAVAINDDLKSLSSPTNGLFRVVATKTTIWNPVFQGYDLGDLPANFIDVLGVRFVEPNAYRRFPYITGYSVDHNNPDAAFPSGQAVFFYEGGFPGLPLYITYSAPFLPFVSMADSVTLTPTANDLAPPFNGYGAVTAVANLADTMVDIPPLGAAIQLTLPGEIGRNRMDSQPEPRRGQEVPAGSVANSVAQLIIQRTQRIMEEADRLDRRLQFPRGW